MGISERIFSLTPSPKVRSPVEEEGVESPTSGSPDEEHYEFKTRTPSYKRKIPKHC